MALFVDCCCGCLLWMRSVDTKTDRQRAAEIQLNTGVCSDKVQYSLGRLPLSSSDLLPVIEAWNQPLVVVVSYWLGVIEAAAADDGVWKREKKWVQERETKWIPMTKGGGLKDKMCVCVFGYLLLCRYKFYLNFLI